MECLSANKSQARGLLDEFENYDTENIRIIRKTNEKLNRLTSKII